MTIQLRKPIFLPLIFSCFWGCNVEVARNSGGTEDGNLPVDGPSTGDGNPTDHEDPGIVSEIPNPQAKVDLPALPALPECFGQASPFSKDSDGFTQLPTPAQALASGGTVVYVSSSQGVDDPAHGLSLASPLKSLAYALTVRKLLRKNSPDQLLLKRGDTFNESIPTFSYSGQDLLHPMIISAYGSGPRPKIVVSDSGKAMSMSYVHDFIVASIDFYAIHASGSDPVGINFGGQINNVLLEDIRVSRFTNNLTVQGLSGNSTNFVIRRSQILDSFAYKGGSQGAFIYNISGLLIEENIFDHNGFIDRTGGTPAGPTELNQNIYLHVSNQCSVVRGNVIARGSNYGLQARAGGIVENNLFLQNPYALNWGYVHGGSVDNQNIPAGVEGRIENNAVLETVNLFDQSYVKDKLEQVGIASTGGITVGNSSKVSVKNNIMAGHLHGPQQAWGIFLSGDVGLGVHNVTMDGNIMSDLDYGIDFRGQAFGSVKLLPVNENCAGQSSRPGLGVFDANGIELMNSCLSGMKTALAPNGASIVEQGIEIKNNTFRSIAHAVFNHDNLEDIWKDRDKRILRFEGNDYDAELSSRDNAVGFNHLGRHTPDVLIGLQTWLELVGGHPLFLNEVQPLTRSIDSSKNLGSYLAAQGLNSSTQSLLDYLRDPSPHGWNTNFDTRIMIDFVRSGL